jgi:hypothetical protein
MEELKEYYKALKEYYSLKEKYEIVNRVSRKKFFEKGEKNGKSKKQLISEYKNMKHECVNCKRLVNTIFQSTYDNDVSDGGESQRILKAMCGDAINPCTLKIELKCGNVSTYPDYISQYEKELEGVKNKIIDDKNKLLFGYIDTKTALESFDDVKKEITLINEILFHYLEKYTDITDSSLRKEKIKRKQEEIFKDINTMKEALEKKENRNENMKMAIDLYIEQLIPALKELQELKYKYQSVENDEKDEIFQLIQQKYTIHDIEKYEILPEIVHFEVSGNEANLKTTRKKRKSERETPKNTTQKKKTKFIIEEDEDEDEEKEKEEEEE